VSQPSSWMRGLRARGPDLAWSAALVVALAVGGLAAADITVWAMAISFAVAAIAAFALYRGLPGNVRPAHGQHAGPPAGQGPPVGQRPPAGQGHAAETRGLRRPPEGAPDDQRTTQDEPVRPGLVRVVRQPGAAPWWEEHAPVRPGGRAARSAGPRQVDLSQFLDQALIAQCPNCGSFHVDFNNQAEPWAFRCGECRRQWTWQPGTPWPAIAVRPNVRGRIHLPRA
jgi:hypothetical protein